jgi:hypothetical protein
VGESCLEGVEWENLRKNWDLQKLKQQVSPDRSAISI